MISLKEARNFHGHLGPWLVIGLLMGEYALKKIRAKKYFGLKVGVSGLNKKPCSCLIDGLQLSTGATLGKGNIRVRESKKIRVTFINSQTCNNLSLTLKSQLLKTLCQEMSHQQAELMARGLYRENPSKLFIAVKG